MGATTATTMSLDEALDVIRNASPLRAVRVSSARARGYARKFSYWGPVRYRVCWSDRHNWPVAIALERARSARRSWDLALEDALALAESEGRFFISSLGRLTETEVVELAIALREGRVQPANT